MPLRQITFQGKNIKYRNIATLARKLNISVDNATRLVNEQDIEKIFVSENGDLLRFNISENPLFLQDFGVRRVQRKKLFNPSYKIKKNYIVNEVSRQLVKLSVYVEFTFNVSIEEVTRKKTFAVNAKPDNIIDAVTEKIEEYVSSINNGSVDSIVINYDSIQIVSRYSRQTFDLIDNKLRDAVPLELFYENIDKSKYTDCVRDFLKKKYKKISPNTIDKLGDKDGVSTAEIKTFCVKYKIKLIAYDVNKNVICKYIPETRNSTYTNLIYIAHNNHLYPLKNKYLHSIKYQKDIIVDNATKKLIEFIKNGKEPYNISLSTSDTNFIKTFEVDKTRYIENDEYNKCYEILKKFGIEDKIYPYISLKNIGAVIEKLYATNYLAGSIESFFPQADKFVKGGFNYNTIKDSYEGAVTIDKNKCYSYCLQRLPFLISLDYRQSKIIEHNKYLTYKDITKHHLYIIKPNQSSILIPDTNAYSGDHLLFCLQQGLKLYCLEEITTQKHENYLSQFVHDIFYKLNPSDAKTILNIHIGKFERQEEESHFKTVKLCNKEESQTVSGFKHKLKGTDYYIVHQENIKYNITNRKPISIQIKDFSRAVLYNKMLELNIKEEDIIQIKTDSISFIDKKNIIRNIHLMPNGNYNGWKQETFKEPKKAHTANFNNNDLSFKLEPQHTANQKTYYYNCYAGVGKTYYIINKLLPTMLIEDDYIVLTPSHSTLLEYRQNKINCDVIQKYEYSNTLPEQKNIIIDEVFLCGRKGHDIIYKCLLNNKNLFIFGDDKQLLPVRESEQFANIHFYNAFFKYHKQLKTNRRNNFEISFYDKLINDKYNNYNEVKKYQVNDYKQAETIICFRNETVTKYNNLMLEHLGFTDKFQIGVKLICKSNDLREKDIYNNFEFTITNKNDNTKEYELNNDITITHKQLEKYFIPAYAKTSYGVQGKSIKSYYFADEDKQFLINNNRLSYTIISRIKNIL